MMDEAATTDQRVDDLYGAQRGDEVPEDLRTRQARLKACRAWLNKDSETQAARQQAKVDAQAAEEQASGKRKRGREPKVPNKSQDPNAFANPAYPASRTMKTRRGWVQGFNAQDAVGSPCMGWMPAAASGSSTSTIYGNCTRILSSERRTPTKWREKAPDNAQKGEE